LRKEEYLKNGYEKKEQEGTHFLPFRPGRLFDTLPSIKNRHSNASLRNPRE